MQVSALSNTNSGWELGTLSQPQNNSDIIDITNYEPHRLKQFLEKLIFIRTAEQKLAEQKRLGVIGGPVHLGIGQEAIAVGVSDHLRSSDRVFGAHRSHAHILALGADLSSFFAEILGRYTGLSKGMGGSMHLQDKENGFYGSVPIVAGTVPLAAGAALAAKMDGQADIAVAYLGDGAVEEGVVHETLNLASHLQLPILFVVENNMFASHMHISQRQTQSATQRFANANGINHALIDGNDVAMVSQTAKNMIDKARESSTPSFLEAVTYRWLGHVDWREDIDVGVSRSEDDIAKWKNTDPVKRLAGAMLKASIITDGHIDEVKSNIDKVVNEAWDEALKQPFPPEDALFKSVYVKGGR